MASFYLNENNDIEFDGDCVRMTSGCEETIQCIKQNIYEINWDEIFPINDREIFSALIRSAITNTNGVLYISSFDIENVDFNCGNIDFYALKFTAVADCGTIEVSI